MSDDSKKLVAQSDALSDFFESLMRDVAAYDDSEFSKDEHRSQDTAENIQGEEISPAIEKIAAQGIPHTLVAETPALETYQPESVIRPVADSIPIKNLFETLPPVAPAVEAPVAPATPVELLAPVMVPPEEELKAQVSEAVHIADEEVATPVEIPEWRQHDFQAMLFKVAGLTLAVPLVDLNGVVVCELDNVVSMPGHEDFYLGLLNHLEQNVPLVDTARFVLPADKLASLTGDNPHARITRAVMINDCQYALACDEVSEVITLSPDAVRWRTQRTRRRWLAGTVVEHMCAIIDASAFAELLASRTPIQAFRE